MVDFYFTLIQLGSDFEMITRLLKSGETHSFALPTLTLTR